MFLTRSAILPFLKIKITERSNWYKCEIYINLIKIIIDNNS